MKFIFLLILITEWVHNTAAVGEVARPSSIKSTKSESPSLHTLATLGRSASFYAPKKGNLCKFTPLFGLSLEEYCKQYAKQCNRKLPNIIQESIDYLLKLDKATLQTELGTYTPPDMREIFYDIRKHGNSHIKLAHRTSTEVLTILHGIVLCLEDTYLTKGFYKTFVDSFQEKQKPREDADYNEDFARISNYLEKIKNTGNFRFFSQIMYLLGRLLNDENHNLVIDPTSTQLIELFGDVLIWKSKDLRYAKANKKMKDLEGKMEQDHTAFLIDYIKNYEVIWRVDF